MRTVIPLAEVSRTKSSSFKRKRPLAGSMFVVVLIMVLLAMSLFFGMSSFVMSASADSVVASFQIGCRLYDVALDTSTNMIYATDYNCGRLYAINATTNSVVASIPVGYRPEGVAVNEKTDMIYVANSGNNSISVIDGKTNSLYGEIELGTSPSELAVSPEGLLFVSCQNNNSIDIINGSDILIRSIVAVSSALDSGPNGIAFDSASNIVYVADQWSNALTIINGTSFSAIGTLTFPGSSVNYVAVNPVTDLVYVTGLGGISGPNNMLLSSVVYVVSGRNNTLLDTLSAGASPSGTAVDSNANTIYFANSGDDTVSVVNGSTNGLIGNVPSVQETNDVVINAQMNIVYAVGSGMTVISIGNSARRSATSTSSSDLGNVATSATSIFSSSTTSWSSDTALGNLSSSPLPPRSGGTPSADYLLASSVIAVLVVTGIATFVIKRPK